MMWVPNHHSGHHIRFMLYWVSVSKMPNHVPHPLCIFAQAYTADSFFVSSQIIHTPSPPHPTSAVATLAPTSGSPLIFS